MALLNNSLNQPINLQSLFFILLLRSEWPHTSSKYQGFQFISNPKPVLFLASLDFLDYFILPVITFIPWVYLAQVSI